MFEVVLQGPFYSYTPFVINQFLSQSWVDKVVVSTWNGEIIDSTDIIDKGRLIILFNEDVKNPGVGNRNRQIKSTREGLELVDSELAIKARTDQIVYDLPMMKDFYDKLQTGRKLFTLGLYRNYPFHPRDHFFMGYTDDLITMFSAPYDDYEGPDDYTKCLRSEAWIGSYYYSQFCQEAYHMYHRPMEYIVDCAPKIKEALELDYEMREDLFQVFPRINMSWPKHNLHSYHYHVGENLSEYWHEGSW